MNTKYICAFPGRRDSYQVPLALAEAGWLEEFITDFYTGPTVRASMRLFNSRLQEKLGSRKQPGIPEDRIRCLYGATLLGLARARLGYPRSETFALLDRRYSLAAASAARISRASLLLYNPYAYEAFEQDYSHSARKVLFQFHPHPDWERAILREDAGKYPVVASAYRDEVRSDWSEASLDRERNCWRKADLILCASSVTKRSLIAAGAAPARCRVVPYGADTVLKPAVGEPPKLAENFQALFVGSGYQRKGLHHLLYAWKRAVLPAGSRLILVCRRLDAALERLAVETPRVELRRSATAAELQELYAHSSLFVMPSLVEGFGQVFLEALAEGCPVLGTANTCLPDLGAETDGIFLVEPGNLEELAARLEDLSRHLPGRTDLRVRAQSCARRFTWARFRHELRGCLEETPDRDDSQVSPKPEKVELLKVRA